MGAFRVEFLPEGQAVELAEPAPLSDAAADAGVLIDHPCGSNASCGKCRVRFVSEAPEAPGPDVRLISEADRAAGWRLACCATVAAAAQIEVPAVSRAASAKSFGADDLVGPDEPRLAAVHEAELPEPGLEWQWALEDSLVRVLGNVAVRGALPLGRLRELVACAPEGGRVQVVAYGGEVAAIRRAGCADAPLGVALDIGSTSLAGALVELTTGAVLAHASSLNPQVRYGGDVISRIAYATEDSGGSARLHDVLAEELCRLVGQLTADAGRRAEEVLVVCAAGNPAMLHTFAGVDVTGLGVAPYVGAWTAGRTLDAAEAGLHFAPGARVRMMPMIRSNVGADTVAAVIASGMDESNELTVLVDLGTNCEVVLGHRGRFLATSTAAGPAFEGASMAQGMRAAPGAIDRVSLLSGGRLRVRVLGGVKARGICGSGLIDAAAVLLRTRAVDPTGRLHGRDALATKYAGLASRFVRGEHGHTAFVLAGPGESASGVPVMLTALDVRQLQLIKGSIRAGITMLLQEWGASEADLRRVLLAGAFGNYLRKSSVLDIGLVPSIDPERVQFIGNAAGAGARMALVSRRAWERAEDVRTRAEYLELGGHPDYQDIFATAMGFHDSPALLEWN